jgi:dienelactone hydrolase
MAPPITRRSLLVGILGVVGVAALGAVEFARNSLPKGVPHTEPGALESGSFVSAKRGGVRTAWKLSFPPGDLNRYLPVLVVLHGRGGNRDKAFGGGLHLDRFLADTVQHGTAAFAIASVDGGDHSYWHPRKDGDAAGMVVDEFVPLLAKRGLDVSRLGFMGWSMGGYGALYLAGRLGASNCRVAIAESPAIWHEAGQSPDGAFDDAADFDAHAIFGHLDRLSGIPLHIDCGASDGFAPVTRDLRAALTPTPAGGIEPGGHDASYWRSQAPAQLRFVGAHLG